MNTPMRQKSNISSLIRHCLLVLLLCLAAEVYPQQNHIRTFVPRVEVSPTSGATAANSMVTTVYYDVAGRELQSVHHGVTPEGKDLVSHIVYDSLGHKSQEWSLLPLGTQGGGYVPLNAFTGSTYSGAYHIDFSYEPMTCGRVIAETGKTTPGKSVTYEYGYNRTVDELALTHYSVSAATTICNNGTYKHNSLSYTRQTDEDGSEIIVFKDNKDRTVLERRKGVYADRFLDTYYIYDIQDNLTCVLPPPAVDATAIEGTYKLSDTEELEQYAYFYGYDHRGHCISHKKPGTGWYYTIYDADSRPVLTATPEQCIRNEWNFIKYDGLGRVIQEGTVINATPLFTLINHFDTICVKESADFHMQYGYTGNILMGTSTVVLKTNFYDDYSFLTQGQFQNIFLTHPTGWVNPHSLLTGTLTHSLENPLEYSVTAYWYDERARNICILEFDNVNNVCSRQTLSYDFNDNIVRQVEEYHTDTNVITLMYDYTYDHAGRLISSTLTAAHSTGTHSASGTYIPQSYSYDEMCRKSTESLYGDNVVLTHLYYTDGKYRGVESNSLTQYLHYEAEPTIFGSQYFNGRISATETYQFGDTLGTRFYFSYDPFKRLSEAKGYDGSGSVYKNIMEGFGYDNVSNITGLYRSMPEGDVNLITFTHNGNHRVTAADYSSQRYPLEYEYMYIPQGTAADTYAYDLNGNETRDLTRGMLHARYNTLNLPDSITFTGGNILTFNYLADGRRVGTKAQIRQTPIVSPLAFRPIPLDPITTYSETRTGSLLFKNGRLSQIDIPGGYISLLNDTTLQPELKPYFFVKDYLGNVRLTCDGNTGEVLQSLEYLPSGVTYNRVNHSMQPCRFCGKEEVELHGFDMYDSGARWQYSLIPRFSTIDPLAEKYYHISPYAYCAGDPVNLVDPDGRIWDIVWDIYSVASGVSNAIDNIRSDNYTAAMQDVGGVTLDVLAAIIPGVPAVGSTAIKITRAGGDIVDAAKAIDKSGVQQKITKNLRNNLKRATGLDPKNMEAHHMLPQKFDVSFEEAEININHPKYGIWLEKTSHSKKSYEYNIKWEKFFEDFKKNNSEPSTEEIELFMKQVMKETFNIDL